jgi:hypothetical protein
MTFKEGDGIKGDVLIGGENRVAPATAQAGGEQHKRN